MKPLKRIWSLWSTGQFQYLARSAKTSSRLPGQDLYRHLPCTTCLQVRLISDAERASQQKRGKPKEVHLDGNISVRDLARKMRVQSGSVIKVLEEYQVDVSKGMDTVMDLDMAELVANEFDIVAVSPVFADFQYEGIHLPRPPVVTIMGHVDHGKTTLLDFIRKTSVAQNEAGGITQKIGAFSVRLDMEWAYVTFIDTPGHAAFGMMRKRGARLTDLVVLVVAADDGVKQQTVECLQHIKDANVPMIVAINKIDKPNANPEAVKQQLLAYGVQLEELGGSVKSVEISALNGTGVEGLVEMISEFGKDSELREVRACPAEGVVMEVESHRQKGIIASLLITKGTLKKGDTLICGSVFGRVKQLFNEHGQIIPQATVSAPVQVLGWRGFPSPGDFVRGVESEDKAREILRQEAKIEKDINQLEDEAKRGSQQEPEVTSKKKGIPQEMKSGRNKRVPIRTQLRADAANPGKATQGEESGPKKVEIIIKADLSGSLEAVVNLLSKFRSDDVQLVVMGTGIGSVNESDLRLAETFSGIIYSFNVLPTKDIQRKAEQFKVPLRYYDVIYKLLDDIRDELASRLPLVAKESLVGEGVVLKVFSLTGRRKTVAAGCRVKYGYFQANEAHAWRVVREGKVIYEGKLKTLKRGMADIEAARRETECGVTFEGFEDYKEGDVIRCVKIEQVKQELDWDL